MSVALTSGGRLGYVYFDTNGDGVLDSNDLTKITDGDGIPSSGYSDEGVGVLNGTAQVETGDVALLCFVGSNGSTPQCIKNPDPIKRGRQSWHEVRVN